MLVIRELHIAFILISGVQKNEKVNGTKRRDLAFLSEHWIIDLLLSNTTVLPTVTDTVILLRTGVGAGWCQ
jgi:hypothetical protein